MSAPRVAIVQRARCRINQLTQHRLLAHRPGIPTGIGAAGHRARQLKQVFQSTDLLKHLAIAQILMQPHDLDPLLLVVDLHNGVINRPHAAGHKNPKRH